MHNRLVLFDNFSLVEFYKTVNISIGKPISNGTYHHDVDVRTEYNLPSTLRLTWGGETSIKTGGRVVHGLPCEPYHTRCTLPLELYAYTYSVLFKC